jgi:hypothetical protein
MLTDSTDVSTVFFSHLWKGAYDSLHSKPRPSRSQRSKRDATDSKGVTLGGVRSIRKARELCDATRRDNAARRQLLCRAGGH